MADARTDEIQNRSPLPPEPITPDVRFLERLEQSGPYNTSACYQCRKCTNGCPVTFAMDLLPDEVIRLAILGQSEAVLRCHTIWVCAACETCTTRCPNEVKIAELMDGLKEMAVQENIPSPQPRILILHQTFLKTLYKRGRVHETAFLPQYLLRSGGIRQMRQDGTLGEEIRLGWQMFRRGRLPLRPKTIRGKKEVRSLLNRRQKR